MTSTADMLQHGLLSAALSARHSALATTQHIQEGRKKDKSRHDQQPLVQFGSEPAEAFSQG